ncbi:Innexin inx2 [Cichlidogyrus casuarinus]|uniref:Innexin n=1 Tax=Cichlidogyrus casuarinus TaxID=1844966 RepID=A0ABD2PTA4_9PLAT
MALGEVVKTLKDYMAPYRFGLIDITDSLNLMTVILLTIITGVVATNQYLLNRMSCYIPVHPSGGGKFNDYLNDYCWVRGTIPFRSDEILPTSATEWDLYDRTRRLNYYQWVPFVLALQTVFFYLPNLCWQYYCTSQTGGDLTALIELASKASIEARKTRKASVDRVAEFLEDLIDARRFIRSGVGKRIRHNDDVEKWSFAGLSFDMMYLCNKALIMLVSGLQLYLIQCFLGLNRPQTQLSQGVEESSWALRHTFGMVMLQYILSGREWPETLLFPRVAFCRVPGIRLVGGDNAYTAQCTLPINMLNEKVYIFLWFWIVFLLFACTLSLLYWLFRISLDPSRKQLIKRYLRVEQLKQGGHNLMTIDSDPKLEKFIEDYLRRDGLFLIRMMNNNAGKVFSSEVVRTLYLTWSARYDRRPKLYHSMTKSQEPVFTSV